jgi:hypothetical protein
MGNGDLGVKRLTLAPVVVIQIGTVVVDDASPLTTEGSPIQSQVPLGQLEGSAFYDELVAKLPEFQAAYDAAQQQHPDES